MDRSTTEGNKYLARLEGVNHTKVPVISSEKTHVWHLFVIKHEDRDGLMKFLRESNVQTAIMYPIALPTFKGI